ncbi:MAG: M20/M25/M40 family metallo-hydrolase [Actinomycetota bacterium]
MTTARPGLPSTDPPAPSHPASPEDGDAVERALAAVDDRRLIELCADLVDIGSPTGGERALAVHLAERLRAAGLHGETQEVEGDLVNAHGTLRGTDDRAPSLLLYAPIDTVTTARPELDRPWAGPEPRPDMVPRAEVRNGVVIGLGAHNPKGHGACLLMVAEALTAAGVRPAETIHIGFGGGGMPANAWAADLADGHGRGCAALVERLAPDAAVITKTGWSVSHEEVGLVWVTVEVAGTHTYVGSRHLLPYRNAIGDAAHLIQGLEAWFPRWAEDHRSGLVAPQGVVAAVDGGWPHAAAFTTALCRVHLDLRVSPRTSCDEAVLAVETEVARLAAEIGAEATCRTTVAIEGTTTDPDHAVIGRCVQAWEAMEQRHHEPVAGLSGATDANILRAAGVPTARIGLPKVSPSRIGGEVDFQLGMNAVDVDDLRRLTELLLRVVIAGPANQEGTA